MRFVPWPPGLAVTRARKTPCNALKRFKTGSETGAAWKDRRRSCPAGGSTLAERASLGLTERTPNPDCHATVLQTR